MAIFRQRAKFESFLFSFEAVLRLLKIYTGNFDPVSMLWEEDPLAKYLVETGNKVYLTRKNPTSEHLAEIILKKPARSLITQRLKFILSK